MQKNQPIQEQLAQQPLALLYLSQPNCSICVADKPRIQKLAQSQPLPLFTINTLAAPEAATLFSVLTVPVVLLFANGKEVHREARIIDFTRLTQQILRYQEALTSVEEQDSYESLFDQLDE